MWSLPRRSQPLSVGLRNRARGHPPAPATAAAIIRLQRIGAGGGLGLASEAWGAERALWRRSPGATERTSAGLRLSAAADGLAAGPLEALAIGRCMAGREWATPWNRNVLRRASRQPPRRATRRLLAPPHHTAVRRQRWLHSYIAAPPRASAQARLVVGRDGRANALRPPIHKRPWTPSAPCPLPATPLLQPTRSIDCHEVSQPRDSSTRDGANERTAARLGVGQWRHRKARPRARSQQARLRRRERLLCNVHVCVCCRAPRTRVPEVDAGCDAPSPTRPLRPASKGHSCSAQRPEPASRQDMTAILLAHRAARQSPFASCPQPVHSRPYPLTRTTTCLTALDASPLHGVLSAPAEGAQAAAAHVVPAAQEEQR
jgi:hypothetical protein